MRYVKFEESFDPTDYLAVLPQVAASLPPGAPAFATDPDHFDFYGVRCVKDLEFGGTEYQVGEESVSITLTLLPNPFKHDETLVIKYSDVTSFVLEVDERPEIGPRFGSLALDEILPHEAGCSHEIEFLNGRVTVICADLEATWQAPS